MPSFTDHLDQANHNLTLLEHLCNNDQSKFLDWKVTICFYTALHLINSHLSTFQIQYRSHRDVNDALNPISPTNGSLPEDEYYSYKSLNTLSRRSRYLVNQKDNNLTSPTAAITYEVHLAKALRHLDKLIIFYCGTYNQNINPIDVKCSGISDKDFNHFTVI